MLPSVLPIKQSGVLLSAPSHGTTVWLAACEIEACEVKCSARERWLVLAFGIFQVGALSFRLQYQTSDGPDVTM
jgi:hypothetical protein